MFKIYLVIISKVVLCIVDTKLIFTFNPQDYLHFKSLIIVMVFNYSVVIVSNDANIIIAFSQAKIIFIAFKQDVKIIAIVFKQIKSNFI
jgi:hypothetical protein